MGDDVSERVASKVDLEPLLADLADRRPEFRRSVAAGVDGALRAAKTNDLLTLTITLASGERSVRRPSPTPDYVQHLIAYLRQKPEEGEESIRSGVEDIVEKAVRDAAITYYQSDETIGILTNGLVREVERDAAVQAILTEELLEQATWLRREIADSHRIAGTQIVGERAVDNLAHAIHAALQTSGGALVAGLLAKAMAYPAVKIAIVKAITTALASAAFQKMLILTMKKAGVGLIVKLALAKLVAGGASMSVGWIVAPIIMAFLVYEYAKLPNKLAGKLAPDVADKVAQQDDLDREIARLFVTDGIAAAQPHMVEFLDQLRDKAMQPAPLRGKGESQLHSDLFDAFLEARESGSTRP